MAIQQYLNTTQVFTAEDFRRAFPDSVMDRNLLVRAVGNGRVDRLRRGLYVSRAEAYLHAKASAFDIAAKAAGDAVFCLLSALQLHGVLHNVSFRTMFYTAHKIARFEYDRQEYWPIRRPAAPIEVRSLLTLAGRRYQVTTKEQTLVDCLDRVRLAGGPENTLRSVGGFRHFDMNLLLGIAERSTNSLRARLGWVLQAKAEEWNVDESTLTTLADSIGGGPHYLCPSARSAGRHWVSRWRLYLPFPEQEMAFWLNQ